MSGTTGYRVGDFRDRGAELARLRAQARMAVAAERGALLELGLPARGRVLDLGCGPGFVSAALRQWRPGLDVVGVDLDPSLLSIAREEIGVVRADATRLPFADESFDFAYARLVLRHLADPVGALSALRRTVRKGARVVVADTDDGAILVHPEPEGLAEVRAARQETHRRRHADPCVGRKLPGMLAEAGLEDVQVRHIVIGSGDIGAPAFAQVVLDPLTQALDPDIMPEERAAEIAERFQRWGRQMGAFGMTVGLLCSGVSR